MNSAPFSLLVCSNGAAEGQPALEYGAHLAGSLGIPARFLGIAEEPAAAARLPGLLEPYAAAVRAAGRSSEIEIRPGRAEEVIPAMAREMEFPPLVLLGGLGRPFWREWMTGKPFRRFLAELSAPLIYVPRVVWPVRSILACAGGLEYATSLENLAVLFAERLGARLTFLHVVGPSTLDYPLAQTVSDHWEHLLETDTPQARNLQAALQRARAAGVHAEVKITRGSVVAEIQKEIEAGGYDLVGLGSPHSARSLRHLYMPNVTAEIADAADCPILAVRAGFQVDEQG